jgi:starch synthase
MNERPLRILMLTEGDAETRDSWSGSSHSTLAGLRNRGHSAVTRDVELYGAPRLLAAAATFAPERKRWSAKYHFGRVGFELRSRKAAKFIREQRANLDVVLQIGATCQPRDLEGIPYVLFCDSNIRLAIQNKSSGFGEAVTLTDEELKKIDEREARVYAGASSICTINQYLERSFVEDYGLDPARVHTINAGPNIDLDVLRVAQSQRPADVPPTVLFVGREFGRKGGNELLAAFKRVRENVPDARLIIVGPRDLQIDQPGVQSLGLINKDTPEGLAALQKIYSEATAFCMPSRFDCFPISLLEAMACGLPCVGTRIAGIPEIIADNETGYVVELDDVEALADRLTRLLQNPEQARAMGKRGRTRVYTLFTWEAVVDRLIAVLRADVEASKPAPTRRGALLR